MKRLIIFSYDWMIGGLEVYLMSQLSYWNHSEHECTIVVGKKTTGAYDELLHKLGIKMIELLSDQPLSPVKRIIQTFSALRKYLNTHPCDILYMNLANGWMLYCAKIAEECSIDRRVVHAHCADIQPGRFRYFKLMLHNISKKLFAQYATDYWACSKKAAEFMFTPKACDRVCCIPNAIDARRFEFDLDKRREERTKWGISSEDIVIGTVGRFYADKNPLFLLKIFAEVCKRMQNIRLLLVGDGPLRPVMEQTAQELGIFDLCIFCGLIEDTAPLYSALDVFCLPSKAEGFGIVALEAQAAGCQCLLSTGVPQSTHILKDTQYLPLREEIWTKKVIESIRLKHSDTERQQAVMCVQKAGFDIRAEAIKTQKILCT